MNKRMWHLFFAKEEIDKNDPVGEIGYNGHYWILYGKQIEVEVFIDCGEYDYIKSVKIKFDDGDVIYDYDEVNGDFDWMCFSYYLKEDFEEKIERLA